MAVLNPVIPATIFDSDLRTIASIASTVSCSAGIRKLMVKLIKTIDDYLKRYPATTWEQVQDAIAQAADVVQEALREPPE